MRWGFAGAAVVAGMAPWFAAGTAKPQIQLVRASVDPSIMTAPLGSRPGPPLPEPYRNMAALHPGERDRRFAEGFPGAVYRVSDGVREYIVRRVDEPTRMLHPAEHCFRGAGYQVKPAPVERNGAGLRSCFVAARSDEQLKVCQHVFDHRGGRWSDVSSWYWHAVFGRSRGPWWAVTEVVRQ